MPSKIGNERNAITCFRTKKGADGPTAASIVTKVTKAGNEGDIARLLRAQGFLKTALKLLFESDYTGNAYPTRTVQQIFSNTRQKAGISKNVGIHSLQLYLQSHIKKTASPK